MRGVTPQFLRESTRPWRPHRHTRWSASLRAPPRVNLCSSNGAHSLGVARLPAARCPRKGPRCPNPGGHFHMRRPKGLTNAHPFHTLPCLHDRQHRASSCEPGSLPAAGIGAQGGADQAHSKRSGPPAWRGQALEERICHPTPRRRSVQHRERVARLPASRCLWVLQHRPKALLSLLGPSTRDRAPYAFYLHMGAEPLPFCLGEPAPGTCAQLP